MVYWLWIMDYGLWIMVYGLWFMVYGLWFMVYGLWIMFQHYVKNSNSCRTELIFCPDALKWADVMMVL